MVEGVRALLLGGDGSVGTTRKILLEVAEFQHPLAKMFW
jgi:hypothetical protein